MTTVLTVTSNPQTFTANTYDGAGRAMNTGVWRFSITPTLGSATYAGGNFHALFAQATGGIWLVDADVRMYTTGDSEVLSQAMTWSALQTITFTIDTRAGTRSITISGATTGNGTFTYATAGPYFDPTANLVSGQFGGDFIFVGTISSIDDTAPDMSWTPAIPASPNRRPVAAALAMAALVSPIVPPSAPLTPLSWAPVVPAHQLRPARRCADYTGMTAPPFAGGASLTVGAAAIRQNILSQLAFSTPLTTFSTNLTFTASGNTLTMATHAMVVCAGPFRLTSTGTLPAGSDSSTLYYMIVPSSTTVQLATTAALAKAGTAVTLTDAGTGTHTLVRAVNTAPLYSTFITIFARGTQATAPDQATDSSGNTYSYIPSAPRAYDNFASSSFSIATSFKSKGGNGHTWSASIGNIGGQQDEVVIAGLEIFNAPILQSSSVVERADGSGATITSGTVTTTAKALLVAVVGGNGNVNQGHVFTTPAGFTRIPQASAEGDVDAAGYIQVEVFVRLVDIKGTYSYSTGSSLNEGAMLWLMAFQAQASDLQPLDWLYPQADPPRAPRRGLPGGETAPFPQPPAAPALSWRPRFPDVIRAIARRPVAGETAPPTLTVAASPTLAWLPNAPELARRPRGQTTGETTPPILPPQNVDTMTWSPNAVQLPAPARGRQGGETAPPFQPPAATAPLWWPVFPDAVARIVLRIPSGETAPTFTPPPAPVPAMGSWTPSFPESARRTVIRTVIRAAAGEVRPVAIVPPPIVPPSSTWSPLAEGRAPQRARRVLLGGEIAPVLIIPGPLHGPRLSPRVTAEAPDLLDVTAAATDLLVVTGEI